MTKFKSESKPVRVENTGLIFFTWAMLIVLFWDFGPIDLYDAILMALSETPKQTHRGSQQYSRGRAKGMCSSVVSMDDSQRVDQIGTDMKWLDKLMGIPIEESPVEKVIDKLPSDGEVNKVYEARWVWYHTILAVEIAFTNVLLLLILAVLAFK